MVTAGQIHPGHPYLQVQENKSAAAWNRGDVLYTASNAWLKAPTTATTSPFGVAAHAALSGDGKGSVITDGVVAVTAGAAIGVNKYVQTDTTTAGRVMEWAGTLPNAIVGKYLGHPTEMDGNSTATAAAAGEVIWIKLGTAGGVGVS
jgi:hypothetical protein